MIFTLYYMYATFMQWWRLGALKNKLNGTLNHQNALVVGTPLIFYNAKTHRSLENLLFQNEDKIACTVVPKQELNLSQWLNFPKDYKCFPIYLNNFKLQLNQPNIFVLIEADLDKYVPHQSELIQVEEFGELVAWKASENFEVILKTDLDNLTKLVHCFFNSTIDINHELKLLKVETVEVKGNPTKVKYDKKYGKEEQLKYSHTPLQWKKFLNEINRLYLKIHEVKNPKIKIENDSAQEESKKVPVYEVKPIKKESKKALEHSAESKNKLEVNDKKKSKTKEKSKLKDAKGKETKEKETKSKHKLSRKKEEREEKTTNTELVQPSIELNGYKVLANGETPVNNSEVPKFHTFASKIIKHLSHFPKPPNVFVYADTAAARGDVKQVLHTVLNKEKYTIYDLPTTGVEFALWINYTKLVVVSGSVSENITFQLLEYFVNGGQLLCLCSDLLYSILKTFSTAEVREHELVRFSYGDWKRVKMMHHIFCYQASPAKKQFSKDSDQSNSSSPSSSPIAPRTPSIVEINHNGVKYTVQVQVLGTEETWQTPSLLLATVKDSPGKAVFSQVHLEIDPTQYIDDEDKFAALKDSDQARLEILRHILSNHLSMDTNNVDSDPPFTPGYFLGVYEQKVRLLEECDSIEDGKVVSDNLTLKFIGKSTDPGPCSETEVPVLLAACPADFSTVRYFENLNTESIGRLVIYANILTSSQRVLSKKLAHGLVVIPRRQSQGSGRSTNKWISPVGSAMFSLQLHVSLNTPLGKKIPLSQHMVMVAVISAIRSLPGYEDLGIGIKWPNDLYTTDGIKVGGLVVNSTTVNKMAIINIGCGVNLDNKNPTTCINDLIDKYNTDFNTNLERIGYERYFALVFNETERIFKIIQDGDLDYLYDLYYKYWLHRNAQVVVTSETGGEHHATVLGIDDFGFLTVELADASIVSVRPDGNTFDMMNGLIMPKPN